MCTYEYLDNMYRGVFDVVSTKANALFSAKTHEERERERHFFARPFVNVYNFHIVFPSLKTSHKKTLHTLIYYIRTPRVYVL